MRSTGSSFLQGYSLSEQISNELILEEKQEQSDYFRCAESHLVRVSAERVRDSSQFRRIDAESRWASLRTVAHQSKANRSRGLDRDESPISFARFVFWNSSFPDTYWKFSSVGFVLEKS